MNAARTARFHVTLVSVGSDGLVHTSEVGRFARIEDAMKAARRAAGPRAKSSWRGLSFGYTGPLGHAAIVE